MKAYIAGAWVEQHQRARPMIAKVREAGLDVTTDWTQAEGDVCSCGAPPARARTVRRHRCGRARRVAAPPRGLCAVLLRRFNGIGSGGDSQLTDTDRIKYAIADLEGVLTADIVWLLAANDKGACGSWVELGAALALRQTRMLATDGTSGTPRIVVSGPKWKRTIFTQLARTRRSSRTTRRWRTCSGCIGGRREPRRLRQGRRCSAQRARGAHRGAGRGGATDAERAAASGIVLCMTMRQLGEMEDNLKATQTRCTELLEQVRTLLACGYPIKETT